MGLVNKLALTLGYTKANRAMVAETANNKLAPSRFGDINSYLKAVTQITWVYKCTSILAESVMMAEGFVKDSKGKTVENTGDLGALLIRPNPYQTWEEFKEGIVYYLLLAGNCYIAKEEMNAKLQPKEIYLIRPDRMKPVRGSNGPSGYVYCVNQKNIPYEVTEIIHLKLFNPLDEFLGMGKIEAATMTYDVEIKAQTYNSVFFDNGAKPSGILATAGMLDDNVFQRVKEQFGAEHKGIKKMHKTAVLEQGLTYTQMGLTQKDMDFVLQRKMSREEILSIFGVPPAKAGILESANYSNSKEQNYTYQSETLTPLLKRIQSKISTGLVQCFNPQWHYEFENVIMRDDVEDSQTAQRYFQMSAITPNEIRKKYMGLEPINDPAMDLIYIGISQIPISDAGAAPVLPAPAKSIKAQCEHEHVQPTGASPDTKTLSARQVIFRESVQLRKRIGKTAKKIMVKFFSEQQTRIIDRLKGKGISGLSTKGITDDIFNNAFENGELQKFAKRYHTSMLSVTIDALNDILDLNIDSTTQNPAITLSLTKLAQKVTRVNDTTKGAIDQVVRQGVEAGNSIDQIAESIQGVYEQATGYRAEMIARTETANAWNAASINSFTEYGSKFVDVIGCEGSDDYPASNCNRTNIPIAEADGLDFHPNHTGCFVPQL